jgi:hypothetical protein
MKPTRYYLALMSTTTLHQIQIFAAVLINSHALINDICVNIYRGAAMLQNNFLGTVILIQDELELSTGYCKMVDIYCDFKMRILCSFWYNYCLCYQ